MQLVVTIYERTLEDAIGAIRALSAHHDMVEVRVDAFGGAGDLNRFRRISPKPIIFTNRGGEPVDVDFAFIDVEYGRRIKYPERTVFSYHDFESMPNLAPLIESLLTANCAYTKIAVTPRTLRENELLLEALRPHLTLFGMGERGLYARILAPFLGSELAFVSVDDEHAGAPGQLSLERALAIYGDVEDSRPRLSGQARAPVLHIFAVVGNPAGHSLSPSIHNPLFRKHGVSAAYTIASVESFDEVVEPFTAKRLTGMSVTAPFKADAFALAQRIGAAIAPNAAEARAVNTLVHTRSGIIADNTDVDGFETLLRGLSGKRAAVVGAGGTGRAAAIALRRAGFDVTVFNRTPREGAQPLGDLAQFTGDVVINTLPASVDVKLPNAHIIHSAYGDRRPATGDRTAQQLLHAQAIRQNDLFLKAFE